MCRRNRYGSYGARRCTRGGYREERNRLIDDIITFLASRHQQSQLYAGQQRGYNVGVVNMQRGAATAAGNYQGSGRSEEKMKGWNQQWRRDAIDPPTYGEVMNNMV